MVVEMCRIDDLDTMLPQKEREYHEERDEPVYLWSVKQND
jgi:hypothetical protein